MGPLFILIFKKKTLDKYVRIVYNNNQKGGKQMGKPKKKKPQSKLEIVETIVGILAGIANIILAIRTILKG